MLRLNNGLRWLCRHQLYILIFIFWAIGLFFRTYRQDQLLGFYYDQGRDAIMAHDIITGHNFPAIGPTTGIQGLFLGPLWYYLITPGYFIGRGDPAIAAGFIAFLESLTIPALFLLLSRYHNRTSATLASFIWAFGYYLMRSSRWFSNPTPLPLFVVILMYLLALIFINKKPKYWPFFTFILGVTLQLEAASAIFFVPITFVLIALNFSTFKLIKLKQIIYSILSFSVLLLPQLAFEIKNKFIITTSFFGFLTGKVNSNTGKSWAIPTLEFAAARLNSYYESFLSKVDTNTTWISIVFLIVFAIGVFLISKKLTKNIFYQIISSWLFIPLFLLLFFVGNYGTLYDYYLTGFFPAFIIIFAISLSFFTQNKFLIPVLVICIYLFLTANFRSTINYITAGVDGPDNVTLGAQAGAVKAVCATSQDYNLTVYVPPKTPYTYDYLFSWLSLRGQCHLPVTEIQKNQLALYEVDHQNPSLLVDWIVDLDRTTSLDHELKFGGVRVQSRIRHKF